MGQAQALETCEHCRFFFARYEVAGACRRHAPLESGHPLVLNEYWCGDFERAGASVQEAE